MHSLSDTIPKTNALLMPKLVFCCNYNILTYGFRLRNRCFCVRIVAPKPNNYTGVHFVRIKCLICAIVDDICVQLRLFKKISNTQFTKLIYTNL